MKKSYSLSKQQIGKLGELLVQYVLLENGIKSAPLTTDSGIDLVAYSPNKKEAFTIQVKANLKPKPGGGKGPLSLDWKMPDDSPANFFAFVDVSEKRIWLISNMELGELAQQHSTKGIYHFYITTEDESKYSGRKGKEAHASKFDRFRLENRIENLFLN